MPERGDALYIQDILDCIHKIEEYTTGYDRDDFIGDRKTVDAVVRNLEIIGEAAHNLSGELRSAHRDIPWEDIIGMRNKVIHEYSGIDLDILWKTLQDDIPDLKKKIIKVK